MEVSEDNKTGKSALNLPDEVKKALCSINVEIGNKQIEFHLSEDLAIKWDAMEFDMDDFPQIYHLWAMIYSEVKEMVNVQDKKMRRRRGKLTGEILSGEGGKGLRRSDITDLIECDDDLLKLEAEHMRLQKLAGKLYFTLEALKMKNDNMRSLFGMKKQEMRSGR